jgi:hypothetical protein
MRLSIVGLSLAVLLILFSAAGDAWGATPGKSEPEAAIAAQNSPSPEDIQWFRDTLRISDKYREREQGIWGMSWAHFLTMDFLILFFIGTMVIAYRRSRRSREILNEIMEERPRGGSGKGGQ